MLEKVTVTNIYGQKLEMELRHPEKSGYAVTGITGIQPVDVDIKTSQFVSGKRFRYNTGFHKLRNVGINIIFYEYNNAHKRIETLRDELYEYFMTNSFVTLTFCKSGLYYSISGVVDKNQPTIFSQATGASISITCPELWFYSSDENGNYIKSEFNGDNSLLSLPISTYFPTGMKSAGTAFDELTEKKAIQRIGVVDLGTLDWAYNSTSGHLFFYADIDVPTNENLSFIPNVICNKYQTVSYSVVYNNTTNKTVSTWGTSEGKLRIYDSSYTDAATFKSAMNGVMLCYEMATPVETDVDLMLSYLVDDFGTEQLLPENTSTPTTSPFVGKIQYGEASSVDTNFTFRPSGGSVDIGSPQATVKSIHGNTLVWNQLINKATYESAKTVNGITFTPNVDGSITINGTSTGAAQYIIFTNAPAEMAITGHKYLLTGGFASGQSILLRFSGVTENIQTSGDPVIATGNEAKYLGRPMYIVVGQGNTYSNLKVYPQFFDLTKIYGSGNEPTTVAAFKALFPLPYYAYNAGSLLNFNGTGLKTVGFNQWDGTGTDGVAMSTQSGGTYPSASNFATGYIKVISGENYYLNPTNWSSWVCFYDANKSYVGYGAPNAQNIITISSKAVYARLTGILSKKATACFNLSQPDISKWPNNGCYLAYKEFVEDENTHETVLQSDLMYDGNFETGFIMELSNDDGIINDEIIYIKTKVGEIETGSLLIAPKNLSDGDKLYIDTTDFSLKIYDQDNNNKIEFLEIESLSDRKPLPVIKENVNIIEVYKLDNSTNPPTKIDVPYIMTYNTLYRGL